MHKPPAIFLMGPTASGKTDLAIALCQHLPCDIISVDSALVYRGLNVGAAKPDASVLKQYPHALIDIRDPLEPYSAALFRQDALQQMQESTQNGRIPLLVGGTMLYFKALLEGMAQMPAANDVVRQQIEQEAMDRGWAAIHQMLSDVDPETGARLKPTDTQRVQRALEVYRVTGIPLSHWHQEQAPKDFPYQVLQLAVCPSDRGVLHQRIEQRFDQMLLAENGMGIIEETQLLMSRGDLDKSLPAIRAVGYRQVWEYLEGNEDLEQMRLKAIAATRQLAKRQLTWLRRWNGLYWIYTCQKNNKYKNLVAAENTTQLEKITEEALNYLSVITTK